MFANFVTRFNEKATDALLYDDEGSLFGYVATFYFLVVIFPMFVYLVARSAIAERFKRGVSYGTEQK